jgi:hypothetical protein
MLNREICLKCSFELIKSKKRYWKTVFTSDWDSGRTWCQYNKDYINVRKEVPEECPYLLEQVICL